MKFIDRLLTEQHHKALRDFFIARAGKMGRRLVTIGWNDEQPSRDWIYFFKDDLGFEQILIIEAYEPNARAATEFYKKQDFIKVYHGTIQDAVDQEELWVKPFDACLWSHGPEHVSVEDHKVVLPKLLNKLRNIFVAWCPWGNWYGIGEQHSNMFQRHIIVDPTHEVFESLGIGLTVKNCSAPKDSPDGLLFIYKEIA
jgi:hypothetical protein